MLSFLFVSACVPGTDIGTKIPLVNEEVLAEQTVEVSKPTLDNPGLSDENDFDVLRCFLNDPIFHIYYKSLFNILKIINEILLKWSLRFVVKMS